MPLIRPRVLWLVGAESALSPKKRWQVTKFNRSLVDLSADPRSVGGWSLGGWCLTCGDGRVLDSIAV